MPQSLGVVAYRALTCPLRLLPDFVVLGTIRGGTTAFYHYLTTHPSIGGATTKEVHYFDWNYAKGPWWYRAHFPTSARQRSRDGEREVLIAGEATPHYFCYPSAPARLAATLPRAKLIVLLRNPVERAFSHYRLASYNHADARSFEEALDDDERGLRTDVERYCEAVGANTTRRTYLAHGLYAEHLQRWLHFFPREQLLILRSEDFFADPGAVLGQALTFLQVPTHTLPGVCTYRHFDKFEAASAEARTTLTPAQRERLSAYFAPHNQRLYALLGRDMGWE